MITLPGVDLSSFQGLPGQWRGPAGKIAWAAVKFTEQSTTGLYVDPNAAADWAALKAMGCGRVAYLFSHPATSPDTTVSVFLKAVRVAGLADTDGIAVDLEVNDGRGPAEVAAWAVSVLRLLEQETGRKPYLYSFPNFIETGNCAGLGGYPLWIADPSSPAGRPIVPRPWTSWAIHQFAIEADIDRDAAAYPTLAAMRAAMGKAAPKPKPKPVREDHVQLNTGPGAVTPIAFRDTDTKVRFFPGSGDQTELSVEFNGHPTEPVTLSGGAGSAARPDGADGCRVVRGTAGATVAVDAVTE